MNKTKKIVILLTIILVFFTMFIHSFVFAIDDPDFYDPGYLASRDVRKTAEVVGTILKTIRTIGVCAAVVILTIIGLKYMFCSIEEKANYKEHMLPYVIGCFLLVSATVIPSMVYEMAKLEKSADIKAFENIGGYAAGVLSNVIGTDN